MTLILAAALLLQDKTAEDAFKKIDEAVVKAKTVRLEFKTEMTQVTGGADLVLTSEGTLLFKGDDKVCYSTRMKDPRGEEEMTLASDGLQLRVRTGKKLRSPRESTKEFASDFKAQFVRGGAYLAYGSSLRPKSKTEESRKQFEPQNLRQGEDDQEAKTLLYQLKLSNQEIDVTLRYDPKTFLPLGRSGAVRKNGVEAGTLRETYKEFALDADLPDEKFVLEEKK
jgi:outer membrane lipoprotein-sorting protein